MKLALVSPKIDCGDVAPPLNLAILATYARKKCEGLEVRIFDATVDEDAYAKLRLFNPNVLGVTATTPQIYEAYRLLGEMKTEFPHVFTIIGGIHATALPDEASNFADCVVVGDGEKALVSILNWLRLGIVVPKIIYGEEIEDLDSLPFPAFNLLDMDQYIHREVGYIPNLKEPLARIITSRGCNYRCIFCWNSKRASKVRYHSAKYMLQEIVFLREKYGIRSIWFHDDEFLENTERLEQFLIGFKKLGLHKEIMWACQARVTNIKTGIPELLKSAGCVCVVLGIESVAPESLRFLKCGAVSVGDVENAVKCCYKAGLNITGSFIFGSVNETLDDMKRTWRWILKYKREGLTTVSFGVLAPYPGSALYNYALTYLFTQDTVNYDNISPSWVIKDHYILDKAVSDFATFLKNNTFYMWADKQLNTHNFRGIFTPTFLRVLIRHPLIIWRQRKRRK